MVIVSVIGGSSGAGMIVHTPVAALQLESPLGIAKVIVSAPELLLAALIAPRSVQSLATVGSQSSAVGVVVRLGSSLLSTEKSAAWAGLAARSTPIDAATSRARSQREKVLALS